MDRNESNRANQPKNSRADREADGLQRHTQKQHEKQFACPYCEKKLSSQRNIEAHVRIHTGEKPYECSTCNAKFTGSANRNRHFRRIHQTERPHSCPQCGKQFANLPDLRLHQETHLKEGRARVKYSCEFEGCGLTYVGMRNMKRHQKTQHKPYDERPHACSYCAQKYVSSSDLVRHVRRHTGEKLYACTTCPEMFSSSWGLRSHSFVHKGERRYACQLKNCQKRFTRLTTLKTHLETHKDARQRAMFECAQCDKKLFTKEGMRLHNATHKDKEEFANECSYCHKKFALSRGLAEHVRIHTGEKPIFCSKCAEGFTTYSALWHHRARVHTDK